ncbi:type II secretion system protein J [Alkalilimnicola ehrlichii]|nr:type II secretion system protein [Alkalilimnicola ehrlichii]
MRPIAASKAAGYTLVELVLVIVIGGILAGLAANAIVQPITASVKTGWRAVLTDEAATAQQRMVREIRRALPNSVRVADRQRVEFISIVGVAGYRSAPGAILLIPRIGLISVVATMRSMASGAYTN